MVVIQKNYQEIMDELKNDLGLELRFTTRVVFINNLSSYMLMVNDLKEMADEVINISNDAYCSGSDSVPDLKRVLDHITKATDKNLLITSIGEYLRFAQSYENRVRCLHSILTFPAHSKKRVWIPVYAAKDIFQNVVGNLSDERYEFFELEDEADEFECFVYSEDFSEKNDIAPIQGLKQMFQAWDALEVYSGISFCTKKLSMVSASTGNYSIHVIKSPFEYIKQHLNSPNTKLDEQLGTDKFWSKLSTFVDATKVKLEDVFAKALNIATFDAQQVVSCWSHLSNDDGFGLWLLWMWYKLGLTASGDYLGYAISRAKSSNDIQNEIECAILSCVHNPSFDSWVNERRNALKNMGITKLCSAFWKEFNSVSDERTKLKLLSNATSEERVKIIEIISNALRNDKKISDYKSILAEKYPDLLLYLKESHYLPNSLGEYIQTYKLFKIMDYYDLSISEAAFDLDTFEYETRGKILNSIKCSKEAYYLWVDGMGVEWTDMLINKVIERKNDLAKPIVEVGMAVVPTTTAANMSKADPDTVSKKYNELDSLSHIKDRNDCSYFSIIDKQFEIIGKIADMIIELAYENPNKSIIVTSDHGMSRMAAKAFHKKQAVIPPDSSKVENLGRYCILNDNVTPYNFAHTYKEDNCLAFREHSHFLCSGYAPGEIHGGASPEEWLVPVITFNNDITNRQSSKIITSYELISTNYILNSAGVIDVKIQTSGEVNSVAVELGAKTFLGVNTMPNQWSVSIPKLIPGNDYPIRVFLNNIFHDDIDTISVKRRGLDVDDDF